MGIWLYIKEWWSELWNPDSKAWQKVDRILFAVLPLIAFIVSRLPKNWRDTMTNLGWIIPLSVWGLFILLVVPYRLTSKYYREKNNAEGKLEPKLEMLFRHADPYDGFYSFEGQYALRLSRVGIKNNGGTTVEGVHVGLEGISPRVDGLSQSLPALFHYMNDTKENPKDWDTEFQLAPGEEKFMDIVSKDDSTKAMFFHLKPWGSFKVPPGDYVITLIAHAYNDMKHTGKFTIHVDEHDHLHFEWLTSDKEGSQT